MEPFKINEYQYANIKRWIDFTYDDIENAVLEEFNVLHLEELNHHDYDAVIEFIQECHQEMNANNE